MRALIKLEFIESEQVPSPRRSRWPVNASDPHRRFCNVPTQIAQPFLTDGVLMPYATSDLSSRRIEPSVSASIESKTHRVLVNRADADLTVAIIDWETEDLNE